MSQSQKDQVAIAAVKTAILKLFGAVVIDGIEVNAGEDHSDEPALFVTVFLKAAQKRMSGSQLLDAIAAASTALREIDDSRFPYVTFLAPEDETESVEDALPAA